MPASARMKRCGILHCWTHQEALIKAPGEGLSYPPHSPYAPPAPGKPVPAALRRVILYRLRMAPADAWSIPGSLLAIVARVRTLSISFERMRRNLTTNHG